MKATDLTDFVKAAALGTASLVDAVNKLDRNSLELILKASAQMQTGVNYRHPEAVQVNHQNFGPKLG